MIFNGYDHGTPNGKNRHGGIALKCTTQTSDIQWFLRLQIIVETGALWLGAYSEYSASLYDLIVDLRGEGLGYRRIAKLLNNQGIETPRGKLWSPSSVFSIIKKRRILDERLNSPPKITLGETRLLVQVGDRLYGRVKR